MHDKIYYELTTNEQKIVSAINTDDNIKIKELISKTKMNSSSINVYRTRLIKKGVLTSNSYGTICFALPRFKDYLQYK